MSGKKKNFHVKLRLIEEPDQDPILRRIQVQSTIIKKILAEIDQHAKIENESDPEKKDQIPTPETN